tara:strand:+ start:42 stop:1565 length:1524 start_codon:yes stop_codon:yes gene_type:complete
MEQTSTLQDQLLNQVENGPEWKWWADKAESKPGIEDDIYRGIGTLGKGVWSGLKAYGEFTDWLDQGIGIPQTDVDVYHARHKIIDPLTEHHFLLGLAGEVLLPDSIDIASMGLTYIPNKILKGGKAAIKTFAKVSSKTDNVTDPIADLIKAGTDPNEIRRMVNAGEIEGIPKGAQISFMAGDKSDEYADAIEKGLKNGTSPLPAWEPLTNTYEKIKVDPRYSRRYGNNNLEPIARYVQDAYNLLGQNGTLRGHGRLEINGTLYKLRRNHSSVLDVEKGTGLKLTPVVSSSQTHALRRSWEWSPLQEAYVRDWFRDRGAKPHVAENYIAIVRADNRSLKQLVAKLNRQYKATHPKWKKAELWSVGHGKSLKHGGPDVPHNRFKENLGKNAARQSEHDLDNIVLRMLGNPITIEEDMARFLTGPSWYKDFFLDMGPTNLAKWATMIGKGMEPNEALWRIWREGGPEVRNSPFFKDWWKHISPNDRALMMRGSSPAGGSATDVPTFKGQE